MSAVFQAAIAALEAGLSIIPVGANKKPTEGWKRYQDEVASRRQVEAWFLQQGHSGLGVVCGPVGGNTEMLEWESRAILEEYRTAAEALGLGALLDRILAGYSSESPGGSIHALYRSKKIGGNTSLARRPKRAEEMAHEKDKIAVLIETRGTGGFTIEPPSNGWVHPTGGEYRQLQGSFASIETTTPEERRALWDLARTFDEMPKEVPRDPQSEPRDPSSPGHDFNARGDVLGLLQSHDWTVVSARNGVTYLCRPGKAEGVSATFGYGGTRYLYVFSTSTPFTAERAYSPFAVYAILEHAGDFSAAARDLAEQGYGDSRPRITVIDRTPSTVPWPVLDEAALYGLAGDLVRTIEPHTEGDPAALLISFLIMIGSAMGPSPHALVGATKHRTNENAVLVGETARARKGTASNEVKRIVAEADPNWKLRVMGGLSSGEGLINAVRDPSHKPDKGGAMKLADPGVEDKRLLAVEPEFSSVLRVAGRDGNTVSEILRRAWDGDDLRTLTRASPLVATSPHVSVLGHITKPEFLRELSETAQANGFANRFPFFCVRRSKELPHGGALPEADVTELVDRVRKALSAARRSGALSRDAETNRVWEPVYSALTAERPGMFGSITARADAHTLRFSLQYALLDGAEAIRRPHLEAALAVWQYAEDSARFIFGDATGDPIADRILSALRANGPMAQTELVDLFARNVRADRLAAALETLVLAGKVHSQRDDDTGGRPRTVWQATS